MVECSVGVAAEAVSEPCDGVVAVAVCAAVVCGRDEDGV